jgi:hypothetical protein
MLDLSIFLLLILHYITFSLCDVVYVTEADRPAYEAYNKGVEYQVSQNFPKAIELYLV